MTFSGWLSDPFEWLSDLQLGDEKVTKNHQEYNTFFRQKSGNLGTAPFSKKTWGLQVFGSNDTDGGFKDQGCLWVVSFRFV